MFIWKRLILKMIKNFILKSWNRYHHHFGMNQWNGSRKISKKENSTGVEEIYITMDKEKFCRKFSGDKTVIETPNGIKLVIKSK